MLIIIVLILTIFLGIHKIMFLYKIMFGIKKFLLVLLTTLIKTFIISSASNHTKCESLSNQRCQTETNLINLQSNEYSQELHYYPVTMQLSWINVLEVAILLLTYLINHVFQIKQNILQNIKSKRTCF